jgi:hypothetical protein
VIVQLDDRGLYVQFLRGNERRRAIGFVFRWNGPFLYSERYGVGWKHQWRLGPLYLRTYARPDE